ncbi:serine-threonine protein kinase, plant-type, putative, partial [Ricinus communis]
RVTKLDLRSLKLAGSISPSVGNLSFLRELNLRNNSFSHEFPQEINHLGRLEILDLSNNSISGHMPANISSCSNLISVRLGRNQIEGNIPAQFGHLFNLQILYVHNNNLTGSIPHSLGNLSYLLALSLCDNNLVGTIPYTIGQLMNLTFLSCCSNRLSGVIPSSVFNLSSIGTLDISGNYFHGSLPSDLGIFLSSIQRFNAFSNLFTGRIPSSISNASNLEILALDINKFIGDVPSLERLPRLQWLLLTSNYLGNGKVDDLSFLYSLTNSSELEILGINGNYFGGSIPSVICNFSTSLIYLFMDNNHLTGSIPSGIGNLVSLQDFEVWNNQLSGFIPPTIGKLQNLRVLDFSSNKFSGQLPTSLGNLTNLIQLIASENNLGGNMPSNLGTCENLLLLNLSHNHLSDAIPPQLLNLTSLSLYLDLSDNQLTGTVPVEVGNLKSLGQLDVSNNKLSGWIPSTLGSCKSLESLHMKGNNFQGLIPSSLGSLKALQVLDLSHNNLSGQIPEFLSQIVLLQLNLSHNNFEGPVPAKGVFRNVSATSLEGNNKLCGGIPEFHLAPCISTRHKKSGLTHNLRIVVATVCVLVGVTLLLWVIVVFFLKKKRRKESSSSFSEKKALELSYHTLYKATDGFSSANTLGAGSFGTVFKGELGGGETSIAVKVFNLMRHGAFKSFIAECEALRNIRHRNLVKVLTACSSVDYQGNEFKALVYEFMVNGSLEEWLHPPDEAKAIPRNNLNILQRLNIAVDVACALDYLHNHCETPIIHCDLKPSNILLDNEMTGHVGDFGLAKFYRERSHQSSSIGIRGSLGYAPAEYGTGNEVSTSGDVYSYGILLLEIFTGKRPMDDWFNEDVSLHNYVKNALPEQVVEILDPTLFQEGEGGISLIRRSNASINRTMECLISICEIGVACSAETPGERMNICDVAGQLVSIRNKLLRN